MNCKNVQDRLSDYLDNNLSGSEKTDFEAHLKECRTCAAEVTAFRSIIAEASSLDRVAAPDSLWNKIAVELDSKKPIYARIKAGLFTLKNRFENSLPIPVPVLRIVGIAVVLLAGVFIGRYFLPSVGEQNISQHDVIPETGIQLVQSRADDYVEKSKIIFLGLVNADTSEAEEMDWQAEKTMARNLINEASYIKENLSPGQDEQIRLLVDELELILLQIANLEQQHDLESIELIKSGIDRKGLLLKINVHDLNKVRSHPERNEKNNKQTES
jgi:hypothetical protein